MSDWELGEVTAICEALRRQLEAAPAGNLWLVREVSKELSHWVTLAGKLQRGGAAEDPGRPAVRSADSQ